ncbi:MAG: precorrin-3B synthase, partial [Paracoccaceae bacterium]
NGGRGRMAGLWPDAGTLERQARLPAEFRTGVVSFGEGDRTIPGPHAMGILVGLEFGQIDAKTFAALAWHPLRITPWRMILLEGVAKAPDLPGLITDTADPRLRVTACTGAPGCPQGLQPTRPLARQLADKVPAGQHLHVSGCAKGCAHPGPADMTLVANRDGFSVIRDGRASDPPVAKFRPLTPLFKVL